MAGEEKPKVRKELGKNIFGTALREAEGAKTVRPGDPNSTSAKFVPKGESPQQAWTREWMERLAEKSRTNESYLTEALRKLSARGSRTHHENEAAQMLKRTGNMT